MRQRNRQPNGGRTARRWRTSICSWRERQPVGEATIPVLSIEDLLICKALFDRSKDWVDIEAVAKTRRGDLDRPYIAGWMDRFLPKSDPRLVRIRAILE